ncbi:uncharacterized protein KGF55_004753 [Candida pseudojiufengensis]|uniref:uncharacterized protein n=1 Tax=Candida pseudojiufengensis TaxID=497109 RepID=UPI00222580FA|nr:uncharacterized protein KGF55_004753 [Candida pseudojiufengensis]KAI5960460.1 hypothetical protein KGF55_004753 [Candida pseudojiufengensis]
MSEMSEEVRALKPVIEDRIYVGNVDYKATEEELKDLFKDLKVTEVEIPSKENTRGDKTFKRRLGFAFVQFETKEDADKAIADLNGQKFQRRNIFIKKAVPPPTEEEKKVKIEAYKAKKEEIQKAKELKKEANKKNDSTNAESTTKPKVPEGEKSKDTIFITNLDYKVNVKALNNTFKDLKPKWIHVPTRRFQNKKYPNGKFRRPLNKGIAFIKFPNEEVQKQAIEEFNGKEINGRELIIDIAVDSKVPTKEEQEAEADENVEDSNGN